MKKGLIVGLVFILVVSLSSAVFAAPTAPPQLRTNSPLPGTVDIIPPDTSTPPALAAFSGIWLGKWKWDFYPDNAKMERDTVIIVEKIEGNNVHIVLSWGPSRPSYSNSVGKWTRAVGVFNPVTEKVKAFIKDMAGEPFDLTIKIGVNGEMICDRPQLQHDGGRASAYKAILIKQ